MMGHYKSGGIEYFTPDDTEKSFYLDCTHTFSMKDILDKIQEKWPGASMEDISITSEYIHTDCIGYDRYTPFDYTNFLCIERIK